MAKRAYSICNHIGCNELIESPGYCIKHIQYHIKQNRMRFDKLIKNPVRERIEQTERWHKVSRLHRSKEPLCRRCKENNTIKGATLVHHEPDIHILLEQNKNPFDDRYLVSLCTDCHLAELRKRKKIDKRK